MISGNKRERWTTLIDWTEKVGYLSAVIAGLGVIFFPRYTSEITIYIVTVIAGGIFLGRLRDQSLIVNDIHQIKVNSDEIKTKIDRVREANASFILDNHLHNHREHWRSWREDSVEKLLTEKSEVSQRKELEAGFGPTFVLPQLMTFWRVFLMRLSVHTTISLKTGK